jgi:hypothetical protein
MRSLVIAATLLMLAGCGLSQPALWGVVEGGKLVVGAVGTAVADVIESEPPRREAGPLVTESGPLVTESNAADTKPTEGYDPLNP